MKLGQEVHGLVCLKILPLYSLSFGATRMSYWHHPDYWGGMAWLCYQLGLVGQPEAPQEPPGSLVSISPTQSRDMNLGLLGNRKILLLSCVFWPGFTRFHSSLPSGKWKFSSPPFNGAQNSSSPSHYSWIICVIVLNITEADGSWCFLFIEDHFGRSGTKDISIYLLINHLSACHLSVIYLSLIYHLSSIDLFTYLSSIIYQASIYQSSTYLIIYDLHNICEIFSWIG